METITITVTPEGLATVNYRAGQMVRLNSEQWSRLQSAKLRAIAEYGEVVANAWYYQTLLELKFLAY